MNEKTTANAIPAEVMVTAIINVLGDLGAPDEIRRGLFELLTLSDREPWEIITNVFDSLGVIDHGERSSGKFIPITRHIPTALNSILRTLKEDESRVKLLTAISNLIAEGRPDAVKSLKAAAVLSIFLIEAILTSGDTESLERYAEVYASLLLGCDQLPISTVGEYFHTGNDGFRKLLSAKADDYFKRGGFSKNLIGRIMHHLAVKAGQVHQDKFWCRESVGVHFVPVFLSETVHKYVSALKPAEIVDLLATKDAK